jgi:hypothetical protein
LLKTPIYRALKVIPSCLFRATQARKRRATLRKKLVKEFLKTALPTLTD